VGGGDGVQETVQVTFAGMAILAPQDTLIEFKVRDDADRDTF
jgi:hypothetical protein